MTRTTHRWALAYDATCGTCRRISRTVTQVCGGKLTIVPLDRPDVRAWRAQALGGEAPWVPTLLRVDDDGVHAWTGPAMAWPLVSRLGPRGIFRVVQALGRMSSAEELAPDRQAPARGRAVLVTVVRLFTGAATAARLLLTGKAPVGAMRENTNALRWATDHKDRLPRTYDEVLAYPVAYRKAIFTVSPPPIKSRLWVDALSRDRAGRTGLTPEQEEVFDRALELAADERLFDTGRPVEVGFNRRLSELKADAARVFAQPTDCSLILKLGEIRADR